MSATTLKALVVALAIMGLAAACSDSGDGNAGEKAVSTTEVDDSTDDGSGDSDGSGGKDACAALPRDVIKSVTGKDPGQGELEHAADNTVCHYNDGEVLVTVEIDGHADIESARTSIEAYGDTCNEMEGIGDESLFCTGGIPAEGLNGQVVWTANGRTYYVVYNFGGDEPSKDKTLELARALDD